MERRRTVRLRAERTRLSKEPSKPDAGVSAATPASKSGREIVAAAGADLERRLSEPHAPGLYLVSTPIGNLGDMTIRALAVLANADLVYCEDTRHSRILLSHFQIDRALRPYHEHNAEAERPRIVAEVEKGKVVALISDAGTPLVSDPGYKLVRDCIDRDLLVTAVPGASAVMGAIAVAGLPTDRFQFAGFLPSREGQRKSRLAELADVQATLVLFEAPNRLAATLGDIVDVLGAERPLAVARELTKRFEEVKRGSALELAAWAAAEPARGEVAIVVGQRISTEVDDKAIARLLGEHIGELGLKEASKRVAAKLGVARGRVYDVGLKLKAGDF
jgi:16S rRNA (cytidine1402-2'-O)-methyltransferase